MFSTFPGNSGEKPRIIQSIAHKLVASVSNQDFTPESWMSEGVNPNERPQMAAWEL